MNWCRETFCENNEKKITSFHVYSTENRRIDQNSSSSFVSENAKIWKEEIITDNIGFDSSTKQVPTNCHLMLFLSKGIAVQ